MKIPSKKSPFGRVCRCLEALGQIADEGRCFVFEEAATVRKVRRTQEVGANRSGRNSQLCCLNFSNSKKVEMSTSRLPVAGLWSPVGISSLCRKFSKKSPWWSAMKNTRVKTKFAFV